MVYWIKHSKRADLLILRVIINKVPRNFFQKVTMLIDYMAYRLVVHLDTQRPMWKITYLFQRQVNTSHNNSCMHPSLSGLLLVKFLRNISITSNICGLHKIEVKPQHKVFIDINLPWNSSFLGLSWGLRPLWWRYISASTELYNLMPKVQPLSTWP